MFGVKPEGAYYYATNGKREYIAWSPTPSEPDSECLRTVGKTEKQFVQEILEGKWDHIFYPEEVAQ